MSSEPTAPAVSTLKADNPPLLEVRNLTVEFYTDKGIVRAVDQIAFTVSKGKTLGVVGESGCGKSVTAMSIMRLIPEPPGRFVSGEVFFRGEDLKSLPEYKMRRLRGNRISMIFQEPMTSLNPVLTIGDQIGEALKTHQNLDSKAARTKTVEMLHLVGIPAPEDRIDVFPHQLSGGMRQRVMIAMALSCDPDLLIADEPTTALDVTIQAQILKLLQSLQEKLQMSIILITHDLGVVAETCDDVQVMYAGRVMEKATAAELFSNPRHPYTLGLLHSIPGWAASHGGETPVGQDGRPRLNTIPGMVPNLLELPKGCAFQERCDRVLPECQEMEPELLEASPNHMVRCLNLIPLYSITQDKSHDPDSQSAPSPESISMTPSPGTESC